MNSVIRIFEQAMAGCENVDDAYKLFKEFVSVVEEYVSDVDMENLELVDRIDELERSLQIAEEDLKEANQIIDGLESEE